MRRKAPAVRQYMTHLPVEAERCETLAEASALMARHDIRHVPVMSGSQLSGIVSQRDIFAAQARLGEQADRVPLQEICQSDVLTVSPLTAIDEVARQMLRHKAGSAVVVDGGFVVGIFTATDALRVLSEAFG